MEVRYKKMANPISIEFRKSNGISGIGVQRVQEEGQEIDRTYQTKDLVLATFLYCKGAILQSILPVIGEAGSRQLMSTFVFETTVPMLQGKEIKNVPISDLLVQFHDESGTNHTIVQSINCYKALRKKSVDTARRANSR